MPMASRRMPHSGSAAISASAIRLLVVGSEPGKSMPAALRIRLRPPSQPTRYSARSDWPSASSTWTLLVLPEPRHLTPAIDRHAEFVDPAGENALDMLLP